MIDNSVELVQIIASFLNKNGNNRKTISIDGYAFEINGIYDIDIPVKSINILPDGSVQFNGNARVLLQDPSSKISNDVKVIFCGVAFFVTDVHGDTCLLRVSIDQMKQSNI